LERQGVAIKLFDYVEHTLSAGGDALAAAYVELEVNGRTLWGVGIDGGYFHSLAEGDRVCG